MSVIKGQARLKKIADQIKEGALLDPDDRLFLSNALSDISNGEDAEVALNVKAKRGERKSKVHKSRQYNDPFMYALIATAIAPEDKGGLGMTLKDAVTLVRENFPNLPAEVSIRRKWNDVKDADHEAFVIKDGF